MGLLGTFYSLQNSTGFCKISLAYIKYIYICHKILETYTNVSRLTQKDKYTLRYLKCLTNKDLLYI